MERIRSHVVQSATDLSRRVLEAIFEPCFLDNSHGFRPSQHTCMRRIRRDSRGTVWYIEGDISKCFDTIGREAATKLLEKRIRDGRRARQKRPQNTSTAP